MTDDLTTAQRRTLRFIYRLEQQGYRGHCLAGDGRAPMISSARALVRRGWLREFSSSSFVFASDEHREKARLMVLEYDNSRKENEKHE